MGQRMKRLIKHWGKCFRVRFVARCVPVIMAAVVIYAAAPLYDAQDAFAEGPITSGKVPDILGAGPTIPKANIPSTPAAKPVCSATQTTDCIILDANCTTFGKRAKEEFKDTRVGGYSGNKRGFLSDIYFFLKTTVGTATRALFQSFTNNFGFQQAVGGAMTLMVLFYGIAFTLGIVQPNFQQLLIRLIKMGVVLAVVSPGGWWFFSQYVVTFFQDGTDDLIKGVQEIGMGITIPSNATPFYALDRIAEFMIQPDTMIAIMGSVFAGGPFGLSMGALMAIAFAGMLGMLLDALKIYAISFVARAMMMGLAPIFFVFLLFDRTKGLFISWLNALLNLSLQPLLLFTFLSFFISMIETASKDMMGAELCWSSYSAIETTEDKAEFWRFRDPKTKEVMKGDQGWDGSMECLLSGSTTCEEFPINIIDLLSFLILVFLAKRFSEVVQKISNELSNAFVGLDTGGKLEQMLQSKSGGGITGQQHRTK